MLRVAAATTLNGFSCINLCYFSGYGSKHMLSCISSESKFLSSSMGGDIGSSWPNVPRIVLKRGKVQLFHGGNPMVYSGAVDRIIGRPPQSGDSVLVTNGALHPIAWGIYNSVSMFCVRIMQMEDEVLRDASCMLNIEKLLESRISAAKNLRMRLGLPADNTDVYRLVNSEGDRLSGLTVDMLGEFAVVASSAAWVESNRSKIESVIERLTDCRQVFWKPSLAMLKEEGLEVELLQSWQRDSPENSEVGSGIKVVENSIYYKVSLDGQKTGFYADQRESRFLLRSLAKDRTVLDLCCYSGGFSLNAVVGGAIQVTGVDSSLPALELANANKQLNSFNTDSINFVKADITEFMKAAIAAGKSWDLIVLDPPKLAPNKKALRRAMGMYHSLNNLAMRLTKPGGLLMTCSCSGAMTQGGFFLRVLQVISSNPYQSFFVTPSLLCAMPLLFTAS
eukprot:c28259_g1_i2 orf=399-1748(-)